MKSKLFGCLSATATAAAIAKKSLEITALISVDQIPDLGLE